MQRPCRVRREEQLARGRTLLRRGGVHPVGDGTRAFPDLGLVTVGQPGPQVAIQVHEIGHHVLDRGPVLPLRRDRHDRAGRDGQAAVRVDRFFRELRVGEERARLELEIGRDLPGAIHLDAFLLGLAAVEGAAQPERIVGSAARGVELDVIPLHEEQGDVERDRVVQPLALEAGFVVAELVRLIGQRQDTGGRGPLAVAAAEPEPLAVEQVDHAVVVNVVLGGELEDRVRFLALARVDSTALEVVVDRQAERNVVDVLLVAVVLEPARPARDRPAVGQRIGDFTEQSGLLDRLPVLVRIVDVGRRQRAGDVVAQLVRIAGVIIGRLPRRRSREARQLGAVMPGVLDVLVEGASHPCEAALALRGQPHLVRRALLLLVVERRADQGAGVVDVVAAAVRVGRIETAVVGTAPLAVVGIVPFILDAAIEIRGRDRQLRKAEIALHVERGLVPVVVAVFFEKARDLVVAERRVRFPGSVRLAVLRDQAQRRFPLRIDLPARRDAPAPGLVVVPVLLDDAGVVLVAHQRRAQDVVDVAAFDRVIGSRANGNTVGHRHVEVPAQVVAFLAALGRAEFGVDLRRKLIRIGLVGDVTDRARLRTRAEQGSLRTRQSLDAGEVDQADVDLGRDRRHGLIVQVHRHLAVSAVFGRPRRHTTHDDGVTAGKCGDEVDARQRVDHVRGALHRLPFDVGGRKRRDALRDVLQVDVAPRGGDDDLLQLTRRGTGALRQRHRGRVQHRDDGRGQRRHRLTPTSLRWQRRPDVAAKPGHGFGARRILVVHRIPARPNVNASSATSWSEPIPHVVDLTTASHRNDRDLRRCP